MIRPIIRFNFKITLILLFAALGPLGNMLTPHFFPDSFRIYYFLLPLFPLFFMMTKERTAKVGIILLPILTYSFFSCFCVEQFGSANESHTLFRYFLLLCQLFFIIGAAGALTKQDQLYSILKTYLTFFFISMGFGYLFFFGYYLKFIPLWLIERFSILTQFGFGILRFSPGSYPNEYGIVSSFVLSILTLIYLDNKRGLFKYGSKSFLFLYLSTFLAFLLTTTRAAYLSFFVSFIYIVIKERSFLKILIRASIFLTIIFTVLMTFGFNMFSILKAGFSQKINEGSLGERYYMWQEALEKFDGHGFLGVGFASLTNVHNVYIQLLFELGFFGSILLIGSLFMVMLETSFRYQRKEETETSRFFRKVRWVGLINVLSFAASNHNLNHHLTWLTFLLCLATLRISYLETSKIEALNVLDNG